MNVILYSQRAVRTHIARHHRALRLAVAAALAVPMVVTVGLLSANAATPAFAMDVDPEGSMVVVTVYSARPGLVSGILDELIGALPADEVDDKGRPLPGSEPVLVTLEKNDDRDYEGATQVGGGEWAWFVYEGAIQVGGGEWAFFPWPLSPDFDPDRNPGAPSTEFVRVGGPPPIVCWQSERPGPL